jgi:hypothetical protein
MVRQIGGCRLDKELGVFSGSIRLLGCYLFALGKRPSGVSGAAYPYWNRDLLRILSFSLD